MASKSRKANPATIHDDQLTAHLVQSVLGWRATPGRFYKANRSFTSRWRFNPLTCLDDAFKLLDEAGAEYQITRGRNGEFTATVQVGGGKGRAEGAERPRTIVTALVTALGLDV